MANKTILIVEDEADLAMMLKMRLEANNYRAIIAVDGQQGLEMARKDKPDLIILDIMLPKLDGFKVCRILKFDQKYKNIPVVILTARTQEADKKMGKEVMADAYLGKPFEPEVLLSKIKELIKK